jgi:hypothetical protein
MNPYLIIACLVAILGAGAGGFKLGADHEVAGQARAEKLVADAEKNMQDAAAKAIASIKVVNKTIQNEVQREVQTNTVYAECRNTPAGLRLLNQALTGDKPAGDSKLPKADAPSR